MKPDTAFRKSIESQLVEHGWTKRLGAEKEVLSYQILCFLERLAEFDYQRRKK